MGERILLPDYDQSVATYERYAEPGTGAFAVPLVELASITPGARTLDVAAGTGVVSAALLAAGARVTATDLSVPMVARLAARYPVTALAMDGQALTFVDDSFDAALSLFGVMLFPDWAQGLRELVRVVRPGGTVAIGSWSAMTAPMRLFERGLAAVRPDLLPLPMPPGMATLGDADAARAVFAELGLEDIRSRRLALPWPQNASGVAAEADAIFTHIPPWPTLDDDERAQLRHAMTAVAPAMAPFDSPALLTAARKR